MRKLNFSLTLILALATITACNNQPQYTQAEIQQMQPCTQMGYPLAQCFAAYQYAGRPQSYDWLGNVAAFALGAAANHWWNRQPTYSYNDRYWDTHPRVNGTTVNNTYVIQKYDTAPVQRQQQPSTLNIPQPVPEKNTAQLIPGQQVQPLFTPNKIVPNKVSQPATTLPVRQPAAANQPAFKPIQVQPASNAQPTTIAPNMINKPAANQPAFKPIQVQPAAVKPQAFAPKAAPSAAKPAFKPITVNKSTSGKK